MAEALNCGNRSDFWKKVRAAGPKKSHSLASSIDNISGTAAIAETEVESSRTSLASRTHFEVLGLGLEASSPRKLACPRLEDSTIFWNVKISWSA